MCDKVLPGEREKIQDRRLRRKRHKIQRELEIRQEKQESDGIQGDLVRIVDLVPGVNSENIIERGTIGEYIFRVCYRAREQGGDIIKSIAQLRQRSG